MKHGIKLRKLQRTPSHRWALLRNLVSALLHHETIKTTLPKAKEAARMAEKIITLGKRNTDPARRAAMAYLMPSHHYSPASFDSKTPPLKPLDYPTSSSSSSSSTTTTDLSSDPETFEPPTTLLPKLFQTLSTRYQTRPGGYTRITKFGRRPGDNAPVAILSLVDGPRDLRFEMTARATGRERAMGEERELTGRNRERVLKFRDEEGVKEFERKAEEFEASLRAEGRALNGHRRRVQDTGKHYDELARMEKPFVGRRYQAGEKLPGMSTTFIGLGLARGDLGRRGRGEIRDSTPRYLGEKGGVRDSLSID